MTRVRDRLAFVPSRRAVLAVLLGLGVAAPLAAGPAVAANGGKWVCTDRDCDPYIYDPAKGDPDNIADPDRAIAPGTPFEALPETWLCPLCGTAKAEFVPYRDPFAA